MAMFSDGGVTSPDIWIVITIMLTASISIFLNPLVFRHNIRKRRSIARDLYMTLSTTDFISSIVLSTVLCKRILQPKEEQCIEDYDATFCRTEYHKYNRTASLTEKAVGSVTWYLIYSPMSITSVLAVSRWYQISYPLRIPKRTAVEMSLAALCLLQAIYFPLMLFSDSSDNPTLMIVDILTVWNVSPFGAGAHAFPVEHIFATLQSSLSLIASILTIWSMMKSQSIPGNIEIRARRIRSTKKVSLLSAGNVIYIVMALFDPHTVEQGNRILNSIAVCFLPVVLSTYNPVIYVLLTKGIVNENSRVREN